MRLVNFILDSHSWVQAQRAKDLQPYLKNIRLVSHTPSEFMAAASPEVTRGVPVWLASWRIILSNPELEDYINPDKCLMSVNSHYNVGGGLKPSTCFRKGADPVESYRQAIDILKMVKVVTCNSQILYDLLVNDLPDIRLTPNGVDSNFFVPNRVLPRNPIKIGWTGKVKEAKNYRLLERCMNKLSKFNQIVFFPAVVDRNNPRPMSKKEMLWYYQSIDFYVNTSLHEGAPNGCLEAASCGIPIITTRVGNMPELIEHGQTGFFIEPTEESLMDRLKVLPDIEEPWYNAISMKLRTEIVMNWDWSYRVKAIEEALEAIL